MKVSALKYTILSWVSYLTILTFLLIPFHAFLTVWGSTIVGHYTSLRLWKAVLLALSAIGVFFLLLTDRKIRQNTLTRRLVWVILAYIALNVVWGLLALNQHDVTAKAFGYSMIVNLRFLLFFIITWCITLRMARLRANWSWFVLVPAAVVVAFGLLQTFVLPHNFLTHFGYGPHTIPAFETVNSNHDYYRTFSTLRGANPLGAYLLIPISILTVMLVSAKRNWKQGLFMAASLVVLVFTYSRSAWIGALITIAIILFLSLKSRKTQQLTLAAAVVLVLVAGGLTLALRNNSHFENFIFHTDKNSSVKVSSNDDHASALKTGLSDIRHDPLGKGPGTAGPASFYNDHQPRIAENYFVQIGQETGLIGLGLFILINVGVGYLLWLRRGDPLALSLFASLIGLTFVNMLSHAWADDTLAYVWWGLAGIAMAGPAVAMKKKGRHEKTEAAE
jgi:hypothetical protein